VATADALGCLASIAVLPGQAHDLKGLPEPVGEPGERKAEAALPSRKGRKEVRENDRETYRWRHRTGSFFAKAKELRAVATRYEKTESSFWATFLLASAVTGAR